MLVRTLLRCATAVIFLVCLGLTACSDDTTRIVSPATGELAGGLAAGIDDIPGNSFNVDEYISQGFYDPDDPNQDQQDNWNGGGHDNGNDNGSNKPIDNGLGDDGGNTDGSGFAGGHDYPDDDGKKPNDRP